jgi:exopolyphosphatase / guanosine-5'-triphosphate,3'-diphosphate pyrophosphatase
MAIAIIDLGTNTFHLLIVEKKDNQNIVLYKESTPTYIGKSGINQQLILPDAIERAVVVLKQFKTKIDELGISTVCATGTSAIRNASNQQQFCEIIKAETAIDITVISGEREAALIGRQNSPDC